MLEPLLMPPLVSIIIPCYNAERWVGEAIQSALAQTYAPVEVIIIDDGSTDKSLEVIKTFGDKIRWETGPNRGGNAARNRGLGLSRGEWVQFLDADDYLMPDKITQEIQFLSSHPVAEILFRPMIWEHWTAGIPSSETRVVPEPHDPWLLLARWFLPGTGSGIWLKRAIIEVGGWNESQTCCQEHELYLRLLKANKIFKYCPGGGYVYRQWSDETVCKRDKREVTRRRLEILQEEEDFLRSKKELTCDRLWAINMGRFEMARMVWQTDHNEARLIMSVVRQTDPGFLPRGTMAPPNYRFIYRLLGFCLAETIADWLR